MIAVDENSHTIKKTKDLATSQARANFNKDTAFRLWATSHGRIYVPVDENYVPDPYLEHIIDRDITTPSGIKLSLINPARIVRELDEKFSNLYGVSGSVTSLNPLRPENAPDDWEKEALFELAKGVKEVFEFTNIHGEPYLRLMQPLITNDGCLLCHKDFKIGQLGGGVGVSLPMAEMLEQQENEIHAENQDFFIIWLFGFAGIVASYIYLRREVTAKDLAMSALTSSESRNSAIMKSALDSIITINSEGLVTEINPATIEMFGYSREQMIGHDLAELIIPANMREPHHKQLARQVETGSSTIMGRRVETTAIHANGNEFPIELAINRIDVDEEIYFTAYLRDLTEAHELKEKLIYQAAHDSLTGLINRREFEARMADIIEQASQNDQHCLLYLDLDQFKVINDSHGHSAGDELLRQIGPLLEAEIRAIDTLARLGGDEFAIMLDLCPLEKARDIAGKIIESIRQFRFYWNDEIFNTAVSIGMVPIVGSGINYAELMSAADTACYKAKEEGGSRFHVFRTNDKELAERRGEMSMVNKIQRSLEENQFQLYKQNIQPLSDLKDTGKIHCEILLRMKDNDDSIITPDQFIPAAEHYNLMLPIDKWVVSNTFQWLASLSDLENKISLCSINLSGYSITDSVFISFIHEQLDQYKIPANIICFEITETVAIKNLIKASHFMRELKKTGFLFALDDFGSGVSSFGYLKALPVDFIKIDGVFVQDITTNKVNRAMVKSINEIGKVMDKKTIAEYVEDEHTVDILKELEIDYAQGYYFSRPEPIIK
ncbi:MAG: EAL domain-containing protein [Gammaproteobacteria bacterium]|nr:EAL domain-containing protein [Gammaproteobacteria bacterium]MCW9004607.1 EAL domain-containing protein [Gammaproteobacteria bacterium]MCW9055615.1 EAL domain-containing protein [Gammaproteobacteria bacterium]